MERIRIAVALALVALPAAARGQSTVELTAPPAAAHGYAQVGVGLLEIAHADAGVFVTPHLSVDGMVAWDGVLGTRFGGGLTCAVGSAQGRRPPRHALLLGARLMLDGHARFDSHGDDLSSYVAVPIGYGFLERNGFYLRATVAPISTRERGDNGGHRLAVGGPFVDASAGWVF